MRSSTHNVLRLAAASAAGGGLLLHTLNLGLMAWVRTSGSAEALAIDLGQLAGDALVALAWGIGFSVLALVMIVRAGHRYEVVVAALFLGVYSLWGGFMVSLPFDDVSWRPPVLIACDVLAHSIGIRFTQLFPRPLTPSDVLGLGRQGLRRAVLRVLAALLSPRIYWPFAFAFETAFRLIPIPGPWDSMHVLVWLALGTFYFYASYQRGSTEDRRRIFWILEGVVVFLTVQVIMLGLWAVTAAGVFELDLPLWANWLSAASAWITLGCFVMAVFYAGAFDSGMILRRTTVLGLSGALAVLIFVMLETVVEQLLVEVLGLQSRLGGILGGVGAAVAFRPLTLRVDGFLGRMSSKESRTDAEPGSTVVGPDAP